MTPRPYQSEGAIWLAEAYRALLGDPPGLGKTGQAILAARMVNARKVAVICPAVAVANWQREWAAWWPDGPQPIVVSYDLVVARTKLRLEIAMGLDVLILDEAHYLKNPTAKRTRCIYSTGRPERGLAARATFVWALSGTFAPNNVGEYWTHLYALFPQLITLPGASRPLSRLDYLRQFTGWQPGDPKGVHEIQNKPHLAAILRRAGLRREIEDVLPELPAITWGIQWVPESCASEELNRMEDTPEVQELLARFEEKGDFKALEVHLSTLRRLIGHCKANWVADQVAEELANSHYGKVVVWAHHSVVLDTLRGILAPFGVSVIRGGTPPRQREQAIHAFQRGRNRVFLGQITAAGTAITLTAANQVVFAESSWVPAEMLQAAKRCHRLGQHRPVFVRISALADSIDELIARTLARKILTHLEVGEKNEHSNHNRNAELSIYRRVG